MSQFDVAAVRAQFPILNRTFDGQEAVFYDGPAGTQVPQRTIDAICKYLSTNNANGGGEFATSRETVHLVEKAREGFACFFNSRNPNEIVFGQSMTTLTFALARSIANTWEQGDEIMLTRLDHDANITPWVIAANEKGVRVRYVDFDRTDCTLDLQQYADTLNDRTKLVAFCAASNASGGICPVKKLTQLAHQAGSLVFVDAVHYAPHGPIDVQDWDCDFVACSTYKFFGPHLGVLWGKYDLLDQLQAYQLRPASSKPPGKWTTGTQSFELIAGALATLEYVCSHVDKNAFVNRENIENAFSRIGEFEQSLAKKMLTALNSVNGVEIFGISDLTRLSERVATFSFRHPKYKPRQLATLLGERNIFVWYGNYYALQFSEYFDAEPDGFVRVGLVHYNTHDEIDRFEHQLRDIIA